MKLLIPLWSLVNLSMETALISRVWLVYGRHSSQTWLGILRIGITQTMLHGGWLLSHACISAYLLLPNSYRPRFITPLFVNCVYFLLLITVAPAALVRLELDECRPTFQLTASKRG